MRNKFKIFERVTNTSFDWLFLFVLLAAFGVRVINLNYNSAFSDEGVYITIGRLGLFEYDWTSYGAGLWMAGSKYIYPSLAALSYQLGGLVGSRFLNVLFGILLVQEVYRFTKSLTLSDTSTNHKAAIIAAFFAGFSSVGIYISRLATYDILSFFLMFFSINSFWRARNSNDGKLYFISSITLLLAFMTKIIIGVYYPIFLLISILITSKSSPKQKMYAFKYFYGVFFLGLSIYLILNINNFTSYFSSTASESLEYSKDVLFKLIWDVAGLLYLMTIPAVIVCIYKGKTWFTIAVVICASVIPAVHLFLNRYQTFNKHLYLSVVFLSILIGYGYALLINGNNKLLKYLSLATLIIIGTVYLCTFRTFKRQLETEWKNSSGIERYLLDNVKTNQKVLTENGGAVILALYNNTFPPENISTFDWFEYSGKNDKEAYLMAVDDKYFDYIELDGHFINKQDLALEIKLKLKGKYDLAYISDNFSVYKKHGK